MEFIAFFLFALLPGLLMFGAAVYLIHLWKKPGPDQLQRSRVQDLEEQVSLMREFLRDAMDRIRRLEEAEGIRPALPASEAGEIPPPGPGQQREEGAPARSDLTEPRPLPPEPADG